MFGARQSRIAWLPRYLAWVWLKLHSLLVPVTFSDMYGAPTQFLWLVRGLPFLAWQTGLFACIQRKRDSRWEDRWKKLTWLVKKERELCPVNTTKFIIFSASSSEELVRNTEVGVNACIVNGLWEPCVMLLAPLRYLLSTGTCIYESRASGCVYRMIYNGKNWFENNPPTPECCH